MEIRQVQAPELMDAQGVRWATSAKTSEISNG